MSTNVKAYELRSKSKTELANQLADLKTELSSLRVAQVSSGSANKIGTIRNVRKAIARVFTVMSHKERDTLKTAFAGKKYIPLDLRVKKTRAIRRRLTADESSRTTRRQKRMASIKKVRKYAIKA